MSTKKYFLNLQQKGIFIHLLPIIYEPRSAPSSGTKPKVLPAIIKIKDTDVLPELPDNLGNYYSWSAKILKKYFKKDGYHGKYKMEWHNNNERIASIVIDCDSDKDLDAMVFQ